MISYFKSQQPTIVVVFLLFFVLIKVPFLISGTHFPIHPLQNLWGSAGILFPDYNGLSLLAAQICLLLQAIWFNYLFNKADYNEANSFVPAVYYTLITSILPPFNVFSIFTIIGFLLLAIFHTLLTITIKENNKLECFNLGVLAGILVLLDAHFIFLLPFLVVILYILSPFKFNHFVLLFFGILFPVYVAFSLSYITDTSLDIGTFSVFRFYLFQHDVTVHSIIVLSVMVAYLLFSFISLRGIMFSAGIRRRKNVNMLILLLLGISAVIIFNHQQNEAVFSYLFIPVSIFLTLLMLRIRKKRLGEILNAIFVLVIFVTNIVRIFK